MTPDDIDRSDWILALEADGVPLGIGQQGPLWLINTRAEGEKPGEMDEAAGSMRCSICVSASERGMT